MISTFGKLHHRESVTGILLGSYNSYIADPNDNLWENAYKLYLQMDDRQNTDEK